MTSLPLLLHSINENMFEGFDPYHGSWWDAFLGVWIEIRRVVDLGSLGITMNVGEHCQH